MKKENKIAFVIIILASCLFSVTSLVSAITISSVSTTPSEVAPGGTATVRIVIENNLDKDVENLNVEIDFFSSNLQ